MEIWVLITIAAAFLQNVRSAMQKHLKGRMGTTGATFVRFGFGVPFALSYMAILAFVLDRPMPVPGAAFFFWAVVGGLSQIAATFLPIIAPIGAARHRSGAQPFLRLWPADHSIVTKHALNRPARISTRPPCP